MIGTAIATSKLRGHTVDSLTRLAIAGATVEICDVDVFEDS
jgi:hypothetical protein